MLFENFTQVYNKIVQILLLVALWIVQNFYCLEYPACLYKAVSYKWTLFNIITTANQNFCKLQFTKFTKLETLIRNHRKTSRTKLVDPRCNTCALLQICQVQFPGQHTKKSRIFQPLYRLSLCEQVAGITSCDNNQQLKFCILGYVKVYSWDQ